MARKISKAREFKIITYVRQMMDLGDIAMSSRSSAWQEVEKRYRSFVDPTETNKQSGKQAYPWDETVVIPYSYALLWAKVSYWYTLYMAQIPFMQFQDQKGENLAGADKIELIVEHFNRMQKAGLLLFGFLLDAGKYGIGGGKVLWDERTETRTRTVKQPVTLAGIDLGLTEQTIKEDVKVYDGPKTTLFDPWLVTPDPRVPVYKWQDGNFFGETMFVSWYDLKIHEQPYGPYMNLDEIPKWAYQDALAISRQSYRLSVMGLPNYFDFQATHEDRGFVMVEQLWAKIIPSDLDLGKGDRPEMWLFELANRSTLINATPVKEAHGKFPYFGFETSPDMHSTLNPGDMEILQPLQDFMDWLFNSHIQNVRKALNDMFVVDPERIVLNDLLKPSPMKMIRLRPEFYGTDVSQAIQQLRVEDVTRSHLQDVSMIFDLMQRISAALDALMGVPSARRRTATESAGTMQLAANRLKVTAQLMSAMGMQEWANLQVSLIQQYLTESQKVKIVGQRYSAELQGMPEGVSMNIEPDELQGEWVFQMHDGSMPLDPVRSADTWREIFKAVATVPQMEQVYGYDLGKIFDRGVKVLGVRNPDDLKRKAGAQLMPDAQVMQLAQRGNLVPAVPGRGGPNGGARPAALGLAGLSATPRTSGAPSPG